MARKRLTPARPDFFGTVSDAPEPAASRAPIAQVVGDVALTAAFEQVQAELQSAQREGRMVLSLPLEAVRADYLIRDRLACHPEELEALKESIRTRGQQTPIEVTDLGGGQYGLISGWRRLRALSELAQDTGGLQRFSTVQALVRLPADRPAAYVAMVEENEVRADLSFYERARIVVQAVGAGVYDSDKQALQSLFSSASFSKRSKVKSFMPLVRALDGVVRHPAQIPERLGLSLSKVLGKQPGFDKQLTAALRPGIPLPPEEERAILEDALKKALAPVKTDPNKAKNTPAPLSKPVQLVPGIHIRSRAGRVQLDGEGLTPALIERLQDWLKSQG